MATALAQMHGLDEAKAAQAGLMHDLAKYFKPQKLLEMAQQEGLPIDPVAEVNPHLLHADVSAIVARDVFGVTDEEILAAIANHTLGSPGMPPISCVVFLSDTLEPGRGETPELNALRQISQTNLSEAIWMTCDYTLQYLIAKHRLIHPRAIATRNWFLHHSKSSTHPLSKPVSASL